MSKRTAWVFLRFLLQILSALILRRTSLCHFVLNYQWMTNSAFPSPATKKEGWEISESWVLKNLFEGRGYLGPTLHKRETDTKILAYDHNWDHPQYPLEVISDSEADRFVAGSAFHCYEGDVAAQNVVHSRHPEKEPFAIAAVGEDDPLRLSWLWRAWSRLTGSE
jgi:hypothetical protein